MNTAFKQYVTQLVAKHKGERIYRFDYEGRIYWLKQPEKLSGVWLLLKPNPKQAFLKELAILQEWAEKGAPVPRIAMYGENFFVLEDAGVSISQWVDRKDCSEQQKEKILCDAAQALIQLHRQGLIHGRPAVRDIIWNQGNIIFLDFESRSQSQNFQWQVVRDMLFFFNSLCREEDISDMLVQKTAEAYQTQCNPQYWQAMMGYLSRFRWLYYLLLPFKPIAKKDLIAIYRLFEVLLFKGKK